MARQAGEEGRIALLKGFVRQFLGIADRNSKASRRQVGSCGACRVQCIPRGDASIRFSACSSTTRRCGLTLLRGLASGGDLAANGEVICTILQTDFYERAHFVKPTALSIFR